MKFGFLFIIFSIVTNHNICAYPNNKRLPTINLVKRVSVDTNDTNAITICERMKKAAINKYSNYRDLNSASSNIITSNNGTSSNATASNNGTSSNIATVSNTATSNNISGNGQCTTLIKNMALDEAYYGKMIVGNQKFNMFLDTGSSNFWIPNKNCTSASCQNHNKYDSSKSSTFKPEGNPWSILYGTGSASGVTGIDNVQIGQITCKNQIIGLADNESDDFLTLENDGICGLAFDSLNTINNGAPTIISTLIAQKKINPIFSFHFNHYYVYDDQGSFTLGGVDESKFNGEITYNNVIPNFLIPDYGFWAIKLDDAKVNSSPLSFSGKIAVIDTGTTLMLIPPKDAAAIHSQISNFEYDSQYGVYIIPCDTTAVVSLEFGGVDYKIPSRDLIFLPISSTQCVSSILPVAVFGDPDAWLVGQTFIKNVFSVFDVENRRVGFANSK
ncbi:13729_t:CDS:1 [Dentiscutata erythropus]|uniref:13729_t:CDS:1 n=1 Tax=Dentiscutata erythropus TaxID=1348616 RepID=A0A9N9IAN7_9GLOM|nr:13729_t:CDS:1 [Dentiscutata erythropus]